MGGNKHNDNDNNRKTDTDQWKKNRKQKIEERKKFNAVTRGMTNKKCGGGEEPKKGVYI